TSSFNLINFYFFVILQKQPKSTLIPYTTLFRSALDGLRIAAVAGKADVGIGQYLAQPLGVRDFGKGCVHGDQRATRAIARLGGRSEEHTSELQSRENLVCRLLLEKKKNNKNHVQ